MRKLFLTLGVASAAGLVLVVVMAWVLVKSCSTEVLFITPNAPEAVAIERMLWEEGDPVAPIYGIPADAAQRILFADEDKIIRPAEDPSLVLYAVSKSEGDNPLQEKTVWFFTRWSVLGFGLVGLLGLAGFLLTRRAGQQGS